MVAGPNQDDLRSPSPLFPTLPHRCPNPPRGLQPPPRHLLAHHRHLSPVVVPILLVIVLLPVLPYVWRFVLDLVKLAWRMVMLPFKPLWESVAWAIGYCEKRQTAAAAQSGGARPKRRQPSKGRVAAKRLTIYEDYGEDSRL
ncbi:hypothetical protein QBC36DRAFT_382139 [Triangularia setosa]|uniref:Uncharacterized protein n=1 Tax=Triangularia setosa TaxID=2587417 RepID=A0AAN6W0J6_9PEZI|nr:hypothetical protein QBC36DRAFT_382139 [Podospora setosa]